MSGKFSDTVIQYYEDPNLLKEELKHLPDGYMMGDHIISLMEMIQEGDLIYAVSDVHSVSIEGPENLIKSAGRGPSAMAALQDRLVFVGKNWMGTTVFYSKISGVRNNTGWTAHENYIDRKKQPVQRIYRKAAWAKEYEPALFVTKFKSMTVAASNHFTNWLNSYLPQFRKEREAAEKKHIEHIKLRKKAHKLRTVREREELLDYDTAIRMWEELGENKEAARVRKLKAEQGAVKVVQTVVHGDYVDDRDTIIKDSVVSRSNVGGGSSKMQELKELTEMKKEGMITAEEFEKMKKRIIG